MACSGCRQARPELSEIDQDAFDIWAIVARTQWRTGFSGPTGLDYSAVRQVTEALGLDWGIALLSRIQMLEIETLKDVNKTTPNDRAAYCRACAAAQKNNCSQCEY